ncbi:MAG: hypothetical protein EXR98_05210 [Gemmataceae bacterium]|nr:hypothetical protein [Gemmataceae bacterium]
MMQACKILLMCCIVAISAFAGEPRPTQDLQPRTLILPARDLTLDEVLKELEKQTGNTVADLRRTNRDNPKLTLTTNTFWKTLDAIGAQTKIGFSAYQEGGGVALVDAPYRRLTTVYPSVFRIALKRVAVSRDDETQTHYANLTLDAAWEPRFQPLFLNLESATVIAGKRTEKLERQAMRSVAGMGATEIELRLPAPERAVLQIDSLKGELKVIGAPKMLEFAFEKIGPVTPKAPREAKSQEGVKVSVTEVKQLATRWTVDLQIVNPAGAIIPLESFQSWLDNNRLWLTWTDPQTKKVRTLEPVGETQEGNNQTMKIHFDFTARGNTPLPAKNADVTLRYRTPNRVAAFTVPFGFKDLPLP